MLDPAAAEEREHRYQVHESPALRAIGFSFLIALLLLYDLVFAPAFDLRSYLRIAAVLTVYSAVSWYLLFRFYGKTGKVDLGFVLLNTDVLAFLLALQHTDGRRHWIALLLLARVADQVNTSFRRAFYFSNLISAGFVGYLLFRTRVEHAVIDWQQSLVVLAALWLVGFYISLHARTAERLREWKNRAFLFARDQARDLNEKAAQLARARAEAEFASQAKSDFVANVSHELRTPMNGVVGLTELLLESTLTDEQREHLRLIQMSAGSLLMLLNDLLDFSKIEAGRLELLQEELRAGELVEDVLKMQAMRAAERGLELASQIDPLVPAAVIGDAGRFRQILINLVGNAIKFTGEGEVVVSLAAEPAGERQGRLQLTVRDTGIGVPVEKQGAIFEAFTQADSAISGRYGGTGLGLAITARIVRLMGGEITVESAIGRGSTFHVDIPFQELQSQPHCAADLSLAGRRALVVDDNETCRTILHTRLRSWGIETEAVATGAAALARLRGGGRPFDLILLDSRMPEVDGFAVAEEIRRLDSAGPVIMMLTAVSVHSDSARCRRLGIAAHVVKPIKRCELLDAVRTVLGLQPGAAARRPPAARPAAREPDRPLHILLVEDNPVGRLVAKRLLERRGHQVALAGDGTEAVERCRQEVYDVIFMDVQMPGMNGFEATARIRELGLGARTAIVAMTAHASSEDRERCLAAGMDDYISKPVDSASLAAVLQRVAGVRPQKVPA